MAQTTGKIPLNIILIGKAGHGKSATGNSILGRIAFKRYLHLHSGTKVLTDASAEHGPYEIKVVDGPGLRITDLDGVKNKEQMFENMGTALRMCNGRIHAFVLVIKFGVKYREEDRQGISDLKQIFGENFLQNQGIIVITGGDSFSGQMEADGTPGKTFKDWCREQDTVLGNLIKECSPRVVLFNNISKREEEKTRQRNELLFHAGQFQKVKALDTTEDFQTYEQVRSKFIKDNKPKSFEQTRPRNELPFQAGQLQKVKAFDTTEDFQTYEQVRSNFIKDNKPKSLEQTRPRNELPFQAGQLQKVKALDMTEDFQTYEQVRSNFIKDNKPKCLEQTRPRNELPFQAGQLQKVKALDTTEDFQTYEQVRSKFIKDSKQTSLEETRPRNELLFHAGQLQKAKVLDTTENVQTYEQVRSKFIKDSKPNSFQQTRPREELPFLAGQLQKKSTPTCRMAQTIERIPLNLLLIGKTGHGKSATGNSILGRQAFKSASNAKSETKVVTAEWAEHGQYEIKVVDGPGLGDTDLDAVKDKEQACENMAKALMMCNGGIHAFVLVIKFGTRYTEEEIRTISDLKHIFGENYLKYHGIIVITGGDYFPGQMEADGTPGKTFNEWCCKQVKDFGDLIKECSPRVVLFSNISKNEQEKTRQRNQLLFHAGQLKNIKGLYTTEHFQKYARMRDKLIKDSKQKILEETIQKKISLLSADLERLSIDSSLEDVDTLDACITDVFMEIGDENLQQESMQQLIASLKRLRTTTEELRRAIREENPRAMKSNLVAMSQHQEELNKTRKIPWGYIAAAIGVGLSAVALVVGGTAAVVASGGALAPAALSLAEVLLDAATTFLNKKLHKK